MMRKNQVTQHKLDKDITEAARRGDLDNIKQLRAQGADINAVVNFETVLNAASESGDENTLRYVLDHGQYSDSKKSVILRNAAGAGQLRIVTMLMTEYGIQNKEAIHAAVGGGHANVMEFMLQLASVAPYDKSPLSDTLIHTAVSAKREELVMFLLSKYKPDLNLVDSSRNDVWSIAINRMNINIIRALIAYKADVNKPVSLGFDSGIRAAFTLRHLDIAELLILAGADVNDSRDSFNMGNAPLHLLAQSKDIKDADFIKMTSLLVEYGADVDASNYKWQSAEDIIKKISPPERLQAFEKAVESGLQAFAVKKAVVKHSLDYALPSFPQSLTALIVDYLEIIDIHNGAKPLMLLSYNSEKLPTIDQTRQDSLLCNEKSNWPTTQLLQDPLRQIPTYLSNIYEVIHRDYVIASTRLASVLIKHPLAWDRKDFNKLKLVVHPDKGGDAEDFKAIDAFEKEMICTAESKVPQKLEPQYETWQTTAKKLNSYTKGFDIAVDLIKLYMRPNLQHMIDITYDSALLHDKLFDSNGKQLVAIAAPIYSLYKEEYMKAGLQAMHGYSYYALKKGTHIFFGLSALAAAYEFYEGHYASGILQLLGTVGMYLSPAVTVASYTILYTAQNAYTAYKIYEETTIDNSALMTDMVTNAVTKIGEDTLTCTDTDEDNY